jgi:DNA invertase Pin-like site-specific DNA recombinase
LNTLAAIADRKAGVRSLGDVWADATTSRGRLMLTVLGGLAKFERDLIRQRTADGRERAKERGVKLGRRHAARSSLRISSRKPGSGARTASRSATSPAATTPTTARFQGLLAI